MSGNEWGISPMTREEALEYFRATYSDSFKDEELIETVCCGEAYWMDAQTGELASLRCINSTKGRQ